MSIRVVPQCERCYIKENSRWEADSVGEDGSLISKLIGILTPLALAPGNIYTCASCGEITIIGLFVEMEEDKIAYEPEYLPTDEEDLEELGLNDSDWEDS